MIPPLTQEVAGLLKRKPMSAREVAEALGVSRPTAYAHIAALPAHGYRIAVVSKRKGARGPKATCYRVLK